VTLATCSDRPSKSRTNCSGSRPVTGCARKCTSAWFLQPESSAARRGRRRSSWSTSGPDLTVVGASPLSHRSWQEKRQSNSDILQGVTVHRPLTFGVLLVSYGQPIAGVGRPPSKQDVDDGWKLDIWRSYGSKECRPPLPFGYKRAPAALFDAEAVPLDQLSIPTSPLLTWGPDSPMDALESDTVPEVPGWPLFSEDGHYLRRSSALWQRRYEVWRTERTADPVPDMVSSGERHVPSPPTTATAADVSLPSPPKSSYGSLWKLRRELLRLASAPNSTTGAERPVRRSARKNIRVAAPSVSSSCRPKLPTSTAVAEPDIYVYVNEDGFDC